MKTLLITGINGYLHKCEEYDKAHQVTAFPATIEHKEDLHVITDAVDAAVEKTLNQGCRTGDIFQGLEGEKKVNTKEMGDAIIANL